MALLANSGAVLQINSSRAPVQLLQPSSQVRQPRCLAVRVQGADALCKDLVNERKAPQQTADGNATVSFLGSEGKELKVECAKVGQSR